MSTHMPTLFDDEEYFVSPPKKENKHSEEKTENNADLQAEGQSNVSEAIDVVDNNAALVANEAEDQLEETEPGIAAVECISAVEVHEENVAAAVKKDEESNLPDAQTAQLNMQNALLENKINVQEEDVQIAEMEDASIDDTTLQNQLHGDLKDSIDFEIPEQDEPEFQQEISIAKMIDEPVDDLDKLITTEAIALDYAAYTGLKPTAEKESNTEEADKPQQEIEDEKALDTAIESPKNIAQPAFSSIQFIDDGHLGEDSEETKVLEESSISLPEFQLENRYYTIGEVAQMFGVNISHIRFWTTEFKMKVRTTRKGDRLYNPENIAKLRLIYHLVKENKHTLKGAKEKLKQNKSAVNAQVDLKEKLQFLKGKLEMIKRNL